MANFKIEDIEGIGPVLGEKFRSAGVKGTDALLKNALTPSQRKALAEKTGLSEARVLKFANRVDLYRVSGVGAEYAELLEVAGVDTVPELATRNAASLTQAMSAVNQEKKLTRQVPAESAVTKWIEQAKGLPRMLAYRSGWNEKAGQCPAFSFHHFKLESTALTRPFRGDNRLRYPLRIWNPESPARAGAGLRG
ncbi:DUF4332 domain-containing protein [Thiobacillus denitrificans]|uniref:DUF4332 domain-containing protein n=1 Tax=Thiobacillus denitrificans TaxID=36861 RepID=A0A119CWJ0_THIDE|nr:DUF4332 domain-containing protein [Thiobacillus denitrificans]KVW96679.1 hypothetical protein ABW22_06935 [Thiobacillus denitrificans]